MKNNNSLNSRINKKYICFVLVGLVFWILGIILAPVCSSASSPLFNTTGNALYSLYKPACHQLAERSLAIFSLPMAVCARCFALYLGGLIITLLFLLYPAAYYIKVRYLLWLFIAGFSDFILVKLSVYHDYLAIRMTSGFLLGVSLFLLLNYSLNDLPLKTETRSGF